TSQGRWVPLDEPHHYVPLEQVIANNLHELFRGMEIVHAHAFQITRNADVRRNEEEADDLIVLIFGGLRERRFALVVRLKVEHSMPERTRLLMARELSLGEHGICVRQGLIDHSRCEFFADLDVPVAKFEPWEPVITPRLLFEG